MALKSVKNSQNFNKNSKNLKFKELISRNTTEFCKHTSLHAIKYVADNNLRPSERYYFGVSIITVICIVIYLIMSVYSKWASTPIIVSVNPQSTFIRNEPFPAVTVCNMNQALKEEAKKIKNKNSSQYIMLKLICKSHIHTKDINTVSNWSQLESFIIQVSQPCKDMLIECRYGGTRYSCEKLFFPIVTDEGLCCVFNMLHPKFMYVKHYHALHLHGERPSSYENIDWHAEDGYPSKLPSRYFPKKVRGAGASKGLSLILDVEQDKYYCSSSRSVGFRVAVHAPNETPNLKETGVFLEPGKETKLRIIPEKTETDQHLRSMKVELRHCLFHEDSNLKTFAHYTQRNCEMECVAETCLKYCHCITYHMPKIYRNISVCSLNELSCLRQIEKRMENKSTSCLDDCLPACHELNFQVNTYSTKIAPRGHIVGSRNFGNRSRAYIVKNMAVVHMFFKENSFRSNVKTEFIGISDFLSSIGGLMGLFLGFSFLSITECIFYAIIRPYRSITQCRQTLNMEEGIPIQSPAAKKLKKIRSGIKISRSKKIFATGKQQKDENRLFVEKIKVPYSIAYGFDEPVVKDFYLNEYLE